MPNPFAVLRKKLPNPFAPTKPPTSSAPPKPVGSVVTRPPAPTPPSWKRATVAPDRGEKFEKSGFKIGTGGSRHPAYQMTAAQCSALLDYVPGNIDPTAPTKRMMELEYRLEKLDPHHRFGLLLVPLLRWWNTLDHAEFPNFFAFVDLLDARIATEDFKRPDFMAAAGVTPDFAARMLEIWLQSLEDGVAVRYPTLTQRSRYQAIVDGGIVYWRGDNDQATQLNTAGAETVLGHGGYIWALDRWDRLFTGISDVGRFHHSTLAMGRAVRGAGEWDVDGGVVRRIAGVTGHYRISIYQLYESIRRMRDVLRINLEAAEVTLMRRMGRTDWGGWIGCEVQVPANQFLANPGMRETHALVVDEDVTLRNYGVASSEAPRIYSAPVSQAASNYGVAPSQIPGTYGV